MKKKIKKLEKRDIEKDKLLSVKDRLLNEKDSIIAEKDHLIRKLQKKSGRRDMSYEPNRNSNYKNNKHLNRTPNRTIESLDSMSSAAHEMDSVLNGLIDDTRKNSKVGAGKKSSKFRKSKKSRKHYQDSKRSDPFGGINTSKMQRSNKRKRSGNKHYDDVSRDSECSPSIYRHKAVK